MNNVPPDGTIDDSGWNETRMNTALEDRSYLDFYFPTSTGRRRVVMWENPEITEARQPRYASQPVLQRNEPVRMFTGADARKVTVRFTYTLPHIAEFWNMASPPPGFAGSDPARERYAAFLNTQTKATFGNNVRIKTNGGAVEFFNSETVGPRLYKGSSPGNSENVRGGSNVNPTLNPTWGASILGGWSTDNVQDVPLLMSAAYTLFVIDTLRASVVGQEKNNTTVYGPPIVRFRHGIVFNEAPFIVKDFNVTYDTKAGYEQRSMLPRQIRMSVTLEEFRQVNGSHHGDPEFKLPGYDDIVDLANVDRSRIPW